MKRDLCFEINVLRYAIIHIVESEYKFRNNFILYYYIFYE